MSTQAISIPMLLWRGELRVQGLLLRRPLITAAQAAVGVAILIFAVLRVREALAAPGPTHTLNIAVLVLSLGMLMAANVTLLGERTGTLPWQLQRWASSAPLPAAQTSLLIVIFSFLRSGLLTLTLLAAVAIGALTVAHSPANVAVIVASALLLPLLPVAVGLQWARRRGASVSLAFTIVPLGTGFTAASLPLPLASGWTESALRLIALPGLLLTGRVEAAAAFLFLAGWTAVALVLLRPAALSLQEGLVARGFGSSIWRVSRLRASRNPGHLTIDIAVHRVTLTDLAEILFLGAVSCTVVALQSFATGTAFGVVAMTAAFSAAAVTATIAGYVHMRSAVRLDPLTEAWIRTLPLSMRSLSAARHAVCTAGALLAVAPVMALALARSAPGGHGGVLVALWAGMSVPALTGWFAVYLSLAGWRRLAAGYVLFGWYAVRALAGGAILGVWNRPWLVAALFAVDLGIAAAGQWRGALAAASDQRT
ncbi:MAG TPA: hypothetical protein VGG90_11715 [Candidatus Dormibacteraeota bacterium]